MVSPSRIVLGAVTTTVSCVMPVFLLGGLAVQVGGELGFSRAGLGLAISVYFGVTAVSAVPAGTLVERCGAAVTARAAITLAATVLLAIAVTARSFPTLLLLLSAGAAANSVGQLAANSTLAGMPASRQGLAFGIKQAAIPGATLLSGLSVPTIALTAGWRWAFVLAAAVAVGSLALVPPDRHRATAHQRRTWHRATSALVIVGVAAALAAGAASSMGTFLVDAAVTRGMAAGPAGLLLTLGSVACVAGRIGAGWLADRRESHGDVATVAMLLGIGALGLALLAPSSMITLAVGVLLGFGLGWAWPGLINFAVVQLNPQAPAAATSITQTGVYAGACLGPLAFGATAATAGYSAAWLGGAAAMVVGAGLILVAREKLRWSDRAVQRPPAAGTG